MLHEKPIILVVEDERTTLQLMGEMLEKLEYQPILAENGIEALEALEQKLPDLVISDVLMPKMDGITLCRIIKGNPHTRLIPLVLITGLGSSDDRVRGIEAGADDFISKPFQLAELTARLGSLLKLKQFTDELINAEEVIFSLALAVDAKDPYIHGHCQRLAKISVEIGKQLHLSDEELQALHRGGILHDIGKIGIPESILFKTGPLTAEEIDVMSNHPEKGEQICKPLRTLANALPIIRHHHEHIDGSGYPDKLKGEAIPLGARIVAVVDFFDALITDRPYRKALSHEEALNMLHTAVMNGHLDAQIVDIITDLVREMGEK
ncbi:MAG: response regulator [Deltaproteobacteria bacterium]|nr:response regulator [Deltaproteobacteria bacterium]